MLPDSDIAKRMELGRTKLTYLLNYGIAPHFREQLLETLNNKDETVLLFDESLNREQGQKQLDVHLRFWEGDEVSF